MAYGDGTLKKVKPGVWRVYVYLGNDPITGKPIRPSRIVHGSKADARKARDAIRTEYESGLSVDGIKMTFGEFADTWHGSRVAAGEIVKSHLDREASMIRTLKRYIGDVRLRDITPQMVESLYAAIKADKLEGGGRCSGTTLRMHHALLKQMLRKAVDYDLILRNPCDRVKAPKSDDPERRALSACEAARFLRCVDALEESAYAEMQEKETRQTERGNLFGRSLLYGLNVVSYAVALRIALATGMRRGEVFGLRWGCVDLDGSLIHVRQSLTVYGDAKKPKSRAGNRSIAIDAVTVARLRTWRTRQAAELLKLGIKQGDATPVCCSATGGYVELHRFTRWWQVWRADNGFPDLKFHELRHTQATQLLANGVDVKTVQTRLGHSTAALTLDLYAHAVPGNDRKAAEIVGRLCAEGDGETRILKVKTA